MSAADRLACTRAVLIDAVIALGTIRARLYDLEHHADDALQAADDAAQRNMESALAGFVQATRWAQRGP